MLLHGVCAILGALLGEAIAAGPKSGTQRRYRSCSGGEQVYLVEPRVRQGAGRRVGRLRAGGSEAGRLEVEIHKL